MNTATTPECISCWFHKQCDACRIQRHRVIGAVTSSVTPLPMPARSPETSGGASETEGQVKTADHTDDLLKTASKVYAEIENYSGHSGLSKPTRHNTGELMARFHWYCVSRVTPVPHPARPCLLAVSVPAVRQAPSHSGKRLVTCAWPLDVQNAQLKKCYGKKRRQKKCEIDSYSIEQHFNSHCYNQVLTPLAAG